MPKTVSPKLEVYRSYAQNFTMVAAVLYGLLWIVTQIGSIHGSGVDTISAILIAATSLGGVSMGLLYVVARNRKS